MREPRDSLGRLVAYYAERARSYKTAWKASEFITKRIIPLLEQYSQYRERTKQYSELLEQLKSLACKAWKELEAAATTLTSYIQVRPELQTPEMKVNICLMKSVLNGYSINKDSVEIQSEVLVCKDCKGDVELHRPQIFPSNLETLYQRIKAVCNQLVQMGATELLEDFAVLRSSKQYVTINASTDAEDYVITDVLIIDEFTDFAPSLFKLINLEAQLAQQACNNIEDDQHEDTKVEGAQIAYHVLFSAQWAFTVSRDFFRKKQLAYNSAADLHRSRQLIELITLHTEHKDVDIDGKRKRRAFPRKSQLISALNQILNDLNISYTPVQCSTVPPQAISLLLHDHVNLQLHVEWTDTITEIYHMHSFQEVDQQEYMLMFVERLLNSSNLPIEFDEEYPESANPTKYLRRIGICELLEQFFIAEKSGRTVKLKSKRINLMPEQLQLRRKLCERLGELEHVEWNFNVPNTRHHDKDQNGWNDSSSFREQSLW